MPCCCTVYSVSPLYCRYDGKHNITGSRDDAIREQFPHYRSRRLTHWIRNYKEFKWENIPDADAARWAQVPNSWIRKLKVDRLRGPKEDRYNLPDTIKQQLEQMLVALAKGDNACMSRSEPIFPTDIQETIKWLQARPDSIFVLFCAIYNIVSFFLKLLLERDQWSNMYCMSSNLTSM